MSEEISQAKENLTANFIAALFFVLILGQKYCGFMIAIFIIPFAVWLVHEIYSVVKNPFLRKEKIFRILMWCVAFSLVCFIHILYFQEAREYGDRVVALIFEYRDSHGSYPENIHDVGVSVSELRKNLGMGDYTLYEGKPRLFYAVTYSLFDTYNYNFETRTWHYRGD